MNYSLKKNQRFSADRRVEHLLLSTQLEESGTSNFIIATIIIISVTIIYLLIWAYMTELEEIILADGTIVPKASITSIQHLEGGIIDKVNFKNGDIVQRDDVIIVLSPEPATSELERLRSRHNTLMLNIARLEAFIDGSSLTTEDLLAQLKYQEVENPENLAMLLKRTISYLDQQNLNLQNEQEIIQGQMKKLASNLKNYEQQIALLEDRIAISENQNKIYHTLGESHNISQITILESEKDLKEMHGTLMELRRSRTETINSLAESQDRLESIELELKSAALDQLTRFSADKIEAEKLITRATDRVARLTVKSPAFGIINNLDLKPSGVLPPAQRLFDLVPLEGGLMAETKIKTKDIGHVKIGDNVKVKVSTFDFAIYGSIPGILTKIAPSTAIEPGEKEPYYKATIELKKYYTGDDPHINHILPGMTITAEIIAKKKSVLTYLLKPIRKSLSSAMHER